MPEKTNVPVGACKFERGPTGVDWACLDSGSTIDLNSEENYLIRPKDGFSRVSDYFERGYIYVACGPNPPEWVGDCTYEAGEANSCEGVVVCNPPSSNPDAPFWVCKLQDAYSQEYEPNYYHPILCTRGVEPPTLLGNFGWPFRLEPYKGGTVVIPSFQKEAPVVVYYVVKDDGSIESIDFQTDYDEDGLPNPWSNQFNTLCGLPGDYAGDFGYGGAGAFDVIASSENGCESRGFCMVSDFQKPQE